VRPRAARQPVAKHLSRSVAVPTVAASVRPLIDEVERFSRVSATFEESSTSARGLTKRHRILVDSALRLSTHVDESKSAHRSIIFDVQGFNGASGRSALAARSPQAALTQ
jgi:hypothetical protein